jgi:hypothetical protein
MLLALEVAADAIQEAGLSTRQDGGLKRQLAPSSTAGPRGQGPTSRSTRGLASYALASASPSSMERKTEREVTIMKPGVIEKWFVDFTFVRQFMARITAPSCLDLMKRIEKQPER